MVEKLLFNDTFSSALSEIELIIFGSQIKLPESNKCF